MSTQTAKEYWEGLSEYPFKFTNHRRIYELDYLVPRLRAFKSGTLLDLGCGDGALLECLIHLTGFDRFIGLDLSPGLLEHVNRRVETGVYDFTDPEPLPDSDATVIAGVIQYIFDDEQVVKVLRLIKSDVVFIRSNCTLKPEDEPVERDGYASLYRTVHHTIALISREFEVVGCERVYPDEIESPFGTKQYYFEARRIR